MGKTFYNRFRNSVFMLQYALAAKTMPWAFRLWAGTIFVYFCPDRARDTIFFHSRSSLLNIYEDSYHKFGENENRKGYIFNEEDDTKDRSSQHHSI